MNSERYFLYILPNLPKYKQYKPVLEASGWKTIENSVFIFDQYANYITFRKEISLNQKWSVFFREFPSLNSIIIIIKCLNQSYVQEEQYKESETIFHGIVKKYNLFGINYIKKYIFDFVDDESDFNIKKNQCNNGFLFSETVADNELHQVDLSTFLLKFKYDTLLNKLIKDNIITIVGLSEIVYDLEHRILKKLGNDRKINILKAFWSQKILLLSCPASKIFPKFFKYNISLIDNILDECQMDLVENQSNLIEIQNKLAITQNGLLKRIHLVEGGILFLTFYVIIDVLFTILLETNHNEWISITIALISFYIFTKFSPFKDFIKELSFDDRKKSK